MSSRLDLHEDLCTILGSRNVYFQPPPSVRMQYPAIVYSLDSFNFSHANDGKYRNFKRYKLTYIDADPDNEMVEKLLTTLSFCSFDRHFKSDNLNHYILTIYI